MNRFWNKVILPIIKGINAKHIVEIGCFTGENTKNILKYCTKNNAKLSAIDPKPAFNIAQWNRIYKNNFSFHKDTSLNALPLIKDYDIVLIDGDHNWYTVYNELKIIEKFNINKVFPIVLLHDVAWPYARRDVYYNPNNIPNSYLHPYKKLGMVPNQSDLVEKGGINWSLNNAIYEGGSKNGVLTAVEDFFKETNMSLTFKMTDKSNGLGIIYHSNKNLDQIIDKLLLDFANNLG